MAKLPAFRESFWCFSPWTLATQYCRMLKKTSIRNGSNTVVGSTVIELSEFFGGSLSSRERAQ